MPTSKVELIKNSMIFLNNSFEVLITTKVFEIISIIAITFMITKINENFVKTKTFMIIKIDENFVKVEIFDVVENVEGSLFKNFEYEKDFI